MWRSNYSKGSRAKGDGVNEAANISKHFHPEHFTCSACNEVIPVESTYNIHSTLNQPFHPACYELKFLENCSSCNKKITDGKVVHAKVGEGKLSFHIDCFKCGLNLDASDRTVDACGVQLNSEDVSHQYYTHDGTIYCHECHERQFVPTCVNCSTKIKDLIEGGEKKIRYYTHQGSCFCNECYESVLLPTCNRCGEKIKGNAKGVPGKDVFLTINGEKYHQQCFSCLDCGKQFIDLKAFLWNNKDFYCREHFEEKVKLSRQNV